MQDGFLRTAHNIAQMCRVTACDGRTITVIEGNTSNAVGYRTVGVGSWYIRGFGVPKYASKATYDGGSEWSKEARAWAVDNGIVLGRGTADGGVDFARQENVTREEMAVMLHRLYGLTSKLVAGE